jgi:threonine aldolase
VESARRWRRMLGGQMRQAGIIAAAGIVALDTMVDRLADDHAGARRLALGLARIPGIVVQPEMVQTNIVYFEPPPRVPAAEFVRKLDEHGVRTYSVRVGDSEKIRAVTSRMVTAGDIDDALDRIRLILAEQQ